MKHISIIIFCWISLQQVNAQNVEFKRSNFDDKDAYKEAVNNIKEGDDFRELGNEAIFATDNPGDNFKKALQYYLKAQDFNPDNAELNFKIANCYAYTTDLPKMIPHIKKAAKLDPEVDPFVDYYLGLAYQLEQDFGKALKSYKKFEENYRKADRFSKFVRKHKQECKFAEGKIAVPERVWVDNMGTLNTEWDDYAPSISTDGSQIIFTSNKDNGRDPNEVGEYDDDIYYSMLVDGEWKSPERLSGGINSSGEDVSSMLSYDGTKMLLYRKGDDGSYDIFESKLNGRTWSAPEGFSKNINTDDNQTYASYSYNDVKIYYVNDREIGGGGKGTDYFHSGVIDRRSRKYGTGSPLSEVNTKFNEGPIYLHPDGKTMYLCSEGHNSLGGMDIFVSVKKQGMWSDPVNLGYPINTPYDDYFFAATASNKFAYIASNRAGGKGGMDIYRVTFWGPPKAPLMDTEDYLIASIANPVKSPQLESSVEVDRQSLTVFKGTTIDALTEEPVEAQIELLDNSDGSTIKTLSTNSATGAFLIALNSGKNYGIAVKADGYLFHSENFDIPMESAYNMVDKVIKLKNIKVGSKIALRNIFFETGSAKLKKESDTELDRLVKLLEDVPSLKVEISGHTDNVGSTSMNVQLSQDRAQAVVDYLTQEGIKKSRLVAKGYGESKPVATNASAEGRQQNRRVEFEILEN